ncbi:MAG: 50S ribosomal protein L29 [Fibrobacterales bacterium]|jgi:large subunit ribosomal protein L29
MKASELRELGLDQLNEKLKELDDALFDQKFKSKMGSLDNPSVIAKTRKDIARIKTILKEKAVA